MFPATAAGISCRWPVLIHLRTLPSGLVSQDGQGQFKNTNRRRKEVDFGAKNTAATLRSRQRGGSVFRAKIHLLASAVSILELTLAVLRNKARRQRSQMNQDWPPAGNTCGGGGKHLNLVAWSHI